MGLDMYLYASKYLSKHFGEEGAKKHAAIAKIVGKVGEGDDCAGISVRITAAYWRKANHIHKWFVDNVQDGEDECKTHHVSLEQLEELRNLCKEVIATAKTKKAKIHTSTSWSGGKETKNYEDGLKITNADEISALLPTMSGCFFGGTGYDNYYLEDCKDTIRKIEAILNDPDVGSWDFEYHSSW